MTVALFTPIIDGYIFGFLYTEREQHLPLVTYSWEKLQKPEEQKFSVTYNSIEFSSSEDNTLSEDTYINILETPLFSGPVFMEI